MLSSTPTALVVGGGHFYHTFHVRLFTFDPLRGHGGNISVTDVPEHYYYVVKTPNEVTQE